MYGAEAVLPIKLKVESIRIVLEAKIPENEWAHKRYEELTLINGKRMQVLCNMLAYQKEDILGLKQESQAKKDQSRRYGTKAS